MKPRHPRYQSDHADRLRTPDALEAFRRSAVARRRPVEERFWDHVEPTEGCWEWKGQRTNQGYGVIRDDRRRQLAAHRVSWITHNGAIPDDLLVCHTCDNRGCVNPAHLFLGTDADNARDASRKGRLVGRGGKLTVEQVRAIRDASGSSRAVAARFGISHSAVLGIRRRESYRTWV